MTAPRSRYRRGLARRSYVLRGNRPAADGREHGAATGVEKGG
jgi:hypothetical protein